jgi:hypothetical protein
MINASRYYGLWLALFAVGSIAACSSTGDGGGGDDDNNNNKSGSSTGGNLTTGGTPGAGGAGNKAGSSTGGSGTSGSATGGTPTGGSGGGSSTACAGMKPASNLVTEFMDLMPNATSAGQFTFQAGVPGGTFAYQPMELTVTNPEGTLKVTGTVKNYDGFGVYFTTCTDASAYTGVSFNIKGNAGPTGKLSFRFQSNANTAVDTVNKKGTCMVPAGTADPYPLCHDATFDITVTEGGGEVAVKFSDVMGGVPVATVDGKDIVGLQWAFPWAGATDTMYPVDVTVDNIKFTGGPAGGSGNGGSGGAGGAGGGGAGGGGNGGAGGG